MTGNITKRADMHGGLREYSIVWSCMISSESIISEDLMNTMRFPTVIQLMRSVADTCIIPVQDYLGLGSEARINTPSTLGGNWVFRMKKDAFDRALIQKIRRLTEICVRTVRQ